jgi:hypothetical protein
MSSRELKKKRSKKYRSLDKAERNRRPAGGLVIACGKICIHSASAAKSEIRRVKGRADPDKDSLNYYWCNKCTAYHIGHDHLLVRRSNAPD